MRLLLVGATGLVGNQVLDLALADDRVTAVLAPVRSALPQRPKLEAPVVDFEALPAEAAFWQADAVICALGTTMRQAGSQAAFRRVDHGYCVEVARLARRHGVQTFVLNSAIGADSRSRFFYNRVKGDAEHDIAALGFRSLTLVRPGLIGGARNPPRPIEEAAGAVLSVVGRFLPRQFRINPARTIARAMLDAAIDGVTGTRVIDARDLC